MQVSVHDIGPVGQESSIYTEKFIVPVDADDISKSSKVYTLVICVSSTAPVVGLDSPPNLDVLIVEPSFLKVTTYGSTPPVGVAFNVTVSPEYFGVDGHDAKAVV